MQDVVSLVAAAPPVEAGNNNPMRAGQVRAPVEPEAIAHLLAARAGVPAQAHNTRQHPTRERAALQSAPRTHTSISRGYFLDFVKFGGNIIWYQRSGGEKKKGKMI